MSAPVAKSPVRQNDELQREKQLFALRSELALKEIQREKKEIEEDLRLLEQERQEFDKLKTEASMANTYNQQQRSEIIELNVSGTVFYTLKATLQKHENSILAQCLNGSLHIPRDREGRMFLDRNPTVFALILDYLRTGNLPLNFSSADEEKAFESEMSHFQIGPSSTDFASVWNPRLKSDGLEITEDGRKIEVVGEDGDHVALLGEHKITRGTVTITIHVTIPRPNRYTIGVLPDIPQSFNRGFGYKNGVLGWGLHDHTGSLGIFCQTQLVANSTLGYATGDLVTMIVDVDRGNLTYKVNGLRCAELLNCEVIKFGVYAGVTLFNKGSVWKIVSN